jgi:heat shock protein HslJ
VDETALDGAWCLAEAVRPSGPTDPIDLTDVTSTLTIDSAAGRMSIRGTNSVAGPLTITETSLRFDPEIKTLVRPSDARLRFEQFLEDEFRVGLAWSIEHERLTLSGASGSILRYERVVAEPTSRGWRRRRR